MQKAEMLALVGRSGSLPSLGGIMSLLITDQPPDQKFIAEAISGCLIEFK